MTLYRMFDAAFPPAQPYPGSAAVAGYIGGNTPHVWTLAEWQPFAGLRQLPIWVADFRSVAVPAGNQGLQAAVRMRNLGWRPDAMHRRVIVLDMETAIDPDFVEAFSALVHDHGYGVWVYGSRSTVYSDPHVNGYWVALWDGTASLEDLPDAQAHQFAAGVPWLSGEVDLSVLSGHALEHLGRGPRHVPNG